MVETNWLSKRVSWRGLSLRAFESDLSDAFAVSNDMLFSVYEYGEVFMTFEIANYQCKVNRRK